MQNLELLAQYTVQKQKVKKELDSAGLTVEVERRLWHGTTADRVDKICRNEFNRSFAGKNGQILYRFEILFHRPNKNKHIYSCIIM